MSKRAVIFIDGNNFYHGMRSIKSPSGTRLDYQKFSQKLIGAREWVETRYYIGQVQQKGDLTRYQTQRKFLAYLRQVPRVKIFLGRIESRPLTGCNKKLDKWLKSLECREITLPSQIIKELTNIARANNPRSWTEKEVDVMIATDIISMAYDNLYDVAYLVSADGDFTPAVKKTRKIGRQVLVASPQYGHKLAQAAGVFIPLKQEFFQGCWH